MRALLVAVVALGLGGSAFAAPASAGMLSNEVSADYMKSGKGKGWGEASTKGGPSPTSIPEECVGAGIRGSPTANTAAITPIVRPRAACAAAGIRGGHTGTTAATSTVQRRAGARSSTFGFDRPYAKSSDCGTSCGVAKADLIFSST